MIKWILEDGHLGLSFVGFEGYLEDSVTKRVSIERLNGHKSFIIVGHCHKTKTFAFVCLQVTDHLDREKFYTHLRPGSRKLSVD